VKPKGQTSDVWLAVQQELGQLTKTCLYDRAGLGLSDTAPRLNLSDPGQPLGSYIFFTYYFNFPMSGLDLFWLV
jgi:hypothetical protein